MNIKKQKLNILFFTITNLTTIIRMWKFVNIARNMKIDANKHLVSETGKTDDVSHIYKWVTMKVKVFNRREFLEIIENFKKVMWYLFEKQNTVLVVTYKKAVLLKSASSSSISLILKLISTSFVVEHLNSENRVDLMINNLFSSIYFDLENHHFKLSFQ